MEEFTNELNNLRFQIKTLETKIDDLEIELTEEKDKRRLTEKTGKNERTAIFVCAVVVGFIVFSIQWKIQTNWISVQSSEGTLTHFINALPYIAGGLGIAQLYNQNKS